MNGLDVGGDHRPDEAEHPALATRVDAGELSVYAA